MPPNQSLCSLITVQQGLLSHTNAQTEKIIDAKKIYVIRTRRKYFPQVPPSFFEFLEFDIFLAVVFLQSAFFAFQFLILNVVDWFGAVFELPLFVLAACSEGAVVKFMPEVRDSSEIVGIVSRPDSISIDSLENEVDGK